MKKNLIMLVLVTIAVSLGLKLEFSTADDCYVDESNSCEGLFGELSWSCAEACDFEGYKTITNAVLMSLDAMRVCFHVQDWLSR